MIPKIIHYCWLSDNPYPSDLVKYMSTWKEKLPDYEFRLWNFDRFDKSSSLWVQQAFDNKKYAFAADYIRLFAVYNYGGIYMDMDMEVLKSFDDFLDQKVMIAYESEERTGLEAGCFGAEKGNSFIKDCLSHYAGRTFIKSDGSFDILPLPKIMASFLPSNPDVVPDDWHLFTNKSYKTGSVITIEKSYTIHHFAGSWTSVAQQNFNRHRNYFIERFGSKTGYILSLPFLLSWQLKEVGFKETLIKALNKISRRKR